MTNEVVIAGVIHHNHFPCRLWSRHLDWKSAGDRLSACKGLMKPIGLCLKRVNKRYPAVGELMLIHCCTICDAISINRIAADDDIETLINVFGDNLHFLAEKKRKTKIDRHRELGIGRLPNCAGSTVWRAR